MVGTTINHSLSRQILYALFPPIFAFAYAFFLSQLPVDAFSDRQNYLTYAEHSDLILSGYASGGIMRLLANEPLWLLWNVYLSRHLEPEAAIRVIVFVPAFLFSWTLLRRNTNHIWWMVFLLIMPQIIRNHITALRQGAALSVFILGFYANTTWVRYMIMVISGTIHSSYLFIALVDILTRWIGKLGLSPRTKIFLISGVMLLITIFVITIASALGARQGAQYTGATSSYSGLGFLYWLAVLLLFLSASRGFIIKNLLSFSIIFLYLLNYLINPAIAGRLFESSLFIVFISGLALPGWRRQVFLGSIVLYTILQYLLVLDDPLLGFGPQ